MDYGGPVYSVADVTSERRYEMFSVEELIDRTCYAMGVTTMEVRGDGRNPRVVATRMLIAYMLRENTHMSFPEIARAMGRPNHSTVITAYKRYLESVDQHGMMHVKTNNGKDLSIDIRRGYEAAMRVVKGEE